MVTGFEARAVADRLDDSGSLVAAHHREGRFGEVPIRMCSSEWHSPAKLILTSISSGPGSLISNSSTCHGALTS